MREFFELFERAKEINRWLLLEFGWSCGADWCLNIYLRDRQGEQGKDIISVQSHCKERAFAEGFIKLEEWLFDNNGGY